MSRALVLAAALALSLSAAFVPGARAQGVPLPPTLVVHTGPCPTYEDDPRVLGCATHHQLWVRPGSGPSTYWHEVGHLFDFQVLSDAHRREFQDLINDSRPSWWGDPDIDHEQEYDLPGERFADAYAICAMQATGRRRFGISWWGERGAPLEVASDVNGYETSYSRHRRVCQMIWRAGGLEFEAPRPRPSSLRPQRARQRGRPQSSPQPPAP